MSSFLFPVLDNFVFGQSGAGMYRLEQFPTSTF